MIVERDPLPKPLTTKTTIKFGNPTVGNQPPVTIVKKPK
jgi:hypothetical protein